MGIVSSTGCGGLAIACALVVMSCGDPVSTNDTPGPIETASTADLPPSEPVDAPTPPRPPPRLPPSAIQTSDLPPLSTDASSTFGGWPTRNAVDGNPNSSWYSGTNDSVGKGKRPHFQVTFAEAMQVRHVIILGNRDPQYPRGFTILAGQLDVFDAQDRVVATLNQEGVGDFRDFDFELPDSIEGVKSFRFTSTRDEGSNNAWGDVAIAEIRID